MMTRIPKPNTDLHRALMAVVRHPDALDSAELAAILWPLPPREPTPPIRGSLAQWRAGVQARSDAREALRAERVRRATRLLGRLQEAGLIESRGAPRIAPWWPKRAATRGAVEALRGLMLAGESGMLDEAPASVEVDAALCLSLLARVEKGPRNVRDVLGSEPGGTVKRAWATLRELGIVLVGERRATVDGMICVNNKPVNPA